MMSGVCGCLDLLIKHVFKSSCIYVRGLSTYNQLVHVVWPLEEVAVFTQRTTSNRAHLSQEAGGKP
jgi:hypothetical protein